ncbi:FitA-like ribbon-helix-helix domain-containing protein [Saccharopolyspora flava]|uniref:Antitoxin FitA-like ribbon-helix-helix domain-containing protein n=1 Tax=Saccharopolyspora flava TaxID=95161 RepID=A0A1I6P0U8_9PSEU|nr:plasmid stabilization protein [Saccharopolyspora flava]SFS33812.1 hypothetical protein SAMN05660874_00341 [Saccharopolyspora flava]
MTALTARGFDDETFDRLRVQAARHGRTMGAEALEIIRKEVLTSADRGFGSRIHALFADLSLDDFEVPRASAQAGGFEGLDEPALAEEEDEDRR